MLAQYDQGADIAYNVAGETGLGLLDAAKEKKRYAIGVDSDQWLLFKDSDPDKASYIVVSMLKNVGFSLYRAIKGTQDGTIKYGAAEALGIKEGGIGISDNENFQKVIPARHAQEDQGPGEEGPRGRDPGRHRLRQVGGFARGGPSAGRPFFPTGGSMEAILEARDIRMIYPNGVVANRGVSLAVERNTIHAVVGENGAGKSTLMKILFGMLQPQEGEILYKGQKVHLRSSHEAIRLGIGMVHQHLMLAPELSVAENMILGVEPRWGRLFLDTRRAQEITARVSRGVRPGRAAGQEDQGPAHRGAPAGGDPQGPVPQRGAADPGRAHLRAHPPGSGRLFRHPAGAQEPRQDDHLHLPQAAGGEADRRPGHDHARRARHQHPRRPPSCPSRTSPT